MGSELDLALGELSNAIKNAREAQRHAEDDAAHWREEALEWKRRYEESNKKRLNKVPSIALPDPPRGSWWQRSRRHHTDPAEVSLPPITTTTTITTAEQDGLGPLMNRSQSLDKRRSSDLPALNHLNSLIAATLLLSGTAGVNINPQLSRSDSFAGHATVSVADDGRSGVGATAAAAVSVALAQSWAAVAGKTSQKPDVPTRATNKDRARFKLVAAVPRTNRRGNEGGRDREGPSTPVRSNMVPAESTMALESLDDAKSLDESQEASWRASGSHLKMHWLSPPATVLVCHKPVDSVLNVTANAIAWMLRHSIKVYVEPEVHGEVCIAVRKALDQPDGGALPSGSSPRPSGASPLSSLDRTDSARSTRSDSPLTDAPLEQLLEQLVTWEGCACAHSLPSPVADALDLVITLGGDGTVLWACSLFGAGAVPPVVPLAMGSLGFMTPFPTNRMDTVLERVLTRGSGFPIMLRHRLHCRIIRAGTSVNDFNMDIACGEETTVLNEVVIYRGMAASLANLQCYVDRNFVTAIQGDGLIVSTPTGSTAYNLAAGGSMVHPSVPCVLFTPICPHTLSSRPLVFPEHVTLRVKVPEDSRSDAYCSFDGKGRQELNPGDSVLIHLSPWPVPMVCNLDASHDWFLSVREGLNWNLRKQQHGKGQ